MIAGPLVHRISHTNSPAPASTISLFFNAKIGKIHSPNTWRSHPWWLHCCGTQVLVDGSEPFVAVLTLTGECGVHGIETSPNLLALRNHFLLHEGTAPDAFAAVVAVAAAAAAGHAR